MILRKFDSANHWKNLQHAYIEKVNYIQRMYVNKWGSYNCIPNIECLTYVKYQDNFENEKEDHC